MVQPSARMSEMRRCGETLGNIAAMSTDVQPFLRFSSRLSFWSWFILALPFRTLCNAFPLGIIHLSNICTTGDSTSFLFPLAAYRVDKGDKNNHPDDADDDLCFGHCESLRYMTAGYICKALLNSADVNPVLFCKCFVAEVVSDVLP